MDGAIKRVAAEEAVPELPTREDLHHKIVKIVGTMPADPALPTTVDRALDKAAAAHRASPRALIGRIIR